MSKPSIERYDPARVGVRAGRVVGALTALIATWSLVSAQSSYYEALTLLLEVGGIEARLPVTVLFWGNVILAATARYGIGYVVGSLIGVVYDWLDDPSIPALVAIVVIIGGVDGAFAALDTLNPAFGVAYLAAWVCYVPVFVWLSDGDGDTSAGVRRLGET